MITSHKEDSFPNIGKFVKELSWNVQVKELSWNVQCLETIKPDKHTPSEFFACAKKKPPERGGLYVV